ncbi:MAG: endonuclease-3, partial [Natrialbaceae archaeon]
MGKPRESRDEQAREVVDRLREEYPDSTISLQFSTRLELLVAVVLSGQCTDERVNATTPDLFEKYETAEDYASVAPEELAEDISSITYPNQKAGWLVDAA